MDRCFCLVYAKYAVVAANDNGNGNDLLTEKHSQEFMHIKSVFESVVFAENLKQLFYVALNSVLRRNSAFWRFSSLALSISCGVRDRHEQKRNRWITRAPVGIFGIKFWLKPKFSESNQSECVFFRSLFFSFRRSMIFENRVFGMFWMKHSHTLLQVAILQNIHVEISNRTSS